MIGLAQRNKVRIKLAKAFEKITNQKEHYIHSVVNKLLTYYDIVIMEDLNVRGMLKNNKLAKSIQEIGFYKFKSILTDKAFNNGKQVIFVDRFYPSSKTCSVCGYKKHDLKLSDRVWTCPQCGNTHDRDINAAKNVILRSHRTDKLKAGLIVVGLPEHLCRCGVPITLSVGLSIPLVDFER